jgi:hypothetical protein
MIEIQLTFNRGNYGGVIAFRTKGDDLTLCKGELLRLYDFPQKTKEITVLLRKTPSNESYKVVLNRYDDADIVMSDGMVVHFSLYREATRILKAFGGKGYVAIEY